MSRRPPYWYAGDGGPFPCRVCGRPRVDDEDLAQANGAHVACDDQPVDWRKHAGTRDLWLQIAILRAKAEILDDIAAGVVPVDVESFSELHDYVDANEYGGLCDAGAIGDLASPANDDGACAFANELQDTIHAWIVDGRPMPSTTRRPDPTRNPKGSRHGR